MVQPNEDREFEDASLDELRHNVLVQISGIAINETQTIEVQLEENVHPCEAVLDETQLIERRIDEAPQSYEVLLGKAHAIERRAHRQRRRWTNLHSRLWHLHL